MIVKIVNTECEDYNKEFKLRRMNYDQVVVNYPDSKGIRVFNKDSVEFITETEIDEFLVKYNDFLKIKLNRGISVALYKAILDTIENEYNIAAFLENEKSAKMINQKTILPSIKNDGFFYALLEKR